MSIAQDHLAMVGSGDSKNDKAMNSKVATKLRDIAVRLEQQKANPFRVNAYRHAATVIDHLEVSLEDILNQFGPEGLMRLGGIGKGISAIIQEVLRTGRSGLADRIVGIDDPEQLLQCVPGIGKLTAAKIHNELGIDTLEELEIAAHDGRLQGLDGLGSRRVAAIRSSLAALMHNRVSMRDSKGDTTIVPLRDILAVDIEYREAARTDRLVKIAPLRFNPDGEQWLPILHTVINDRHFTALFSNTARAHKLKRTDDWVVIYFYDEEHREGLATVVTETRGLLQGKRVVRGREDECAAFYKRKPVREI